MRPFFVLAFLSLFATGCVSSAQLREAEDRVYRAIESGDTEAAKDAAQGITQLAQDQEQIEESLRALARGAEGMIPGLPTGTTEAIVGLLLAYGTYKTTRKKVHQERDQKYIDAAKAASAPKPDQPA